MMNTMLENLSPAPNKAYDFESRVAPGMSSRSWVSYYDGQENPDIHKKFIDLAADMGWEYYILDEGWQPGAGKAARITRICALGLARSVIMPRRKENISSVLSDLEGTYHT